MGLKSLGSKTRTDGPMTLGRRKGQSADSVGLGYVHGIQKETSGHVNREGS